MSLSGYIRRKVTAGKTIEITKYFAPRCPGIKIPRTENINTTSEEQWKVNERNSIKKLYYQILANFVAEDIRLDLTHREPCPDDAEAKHRFDNFITRLRRKYRASGHELKWIATTESKGHRVHHHLIINNVGIGRKDLAAMWEYSKIDYRSFRYYDGEPEDAERLANYLVKETRETFCEAGALQKHRWRSSRNLAKPKIEKEIIHSKSWTDNPRPLKGYYIQKPIENGYTAYGYPFQFYRMIREEGGNEPYTKKGRRNVHHKKRETGLSRPHRRQRKHDTGS